VQKYGSASAQKSAALTARSGEVRVVTEILLTKAERVADDGVRTMLAADR
jgi:hypothetical protein